MNVKEVRLRATLPQSANESIGVSLDMSTAVFVRMVTQACLALSNYLHPQSANYVEPLNYIDLNELEVNELRLRQQFSGMQFRDTLTSFMFHQAWDGMEFIERYVELVNAYPDRWHVGEEHWTRELVYRTLVTVHNWTLKQILATHQASGKNFGSAMKQQREYVTKGVTDWPARYEFRALSISPLPKDIPGYYDAESA